MTGMQLVVLTLLAYSSIQVEGSQTNDEDKEREDNLFAIARLFNDGLHGEDRKPRLENDWSTEERERYVPMKNDDEDMSRSLRSPTERDVVSDASSQCRAVCKHCRKVLSIRWAALCTVQCRYRGQAYNACLIAWNQLRHILMS